METIEETLHWIHGLVKMGKKPGIRRMDWMLARIGHPERSIRTIHVAGTNGKGSTVCYLRSMLQEAGYKVGTYTSPFLTIFNERISINGEPIADADLIRAANIVRPLVDACGRDTDYGRPAEFEAVTMISFVYFGRMNRCDIVIYEVGIGGRYDSTNVIEPLVSVITNVAMDHMQLLGDTIADIASEKAGIIKDGGVIVTTAEHPDAQRVIEKTAHQKRARLLALGRDFFVKSQPNGKSGECFAYHTDKLALEGLQLHMYGVHQIKNAAAALAVVNCLNAAGTVTVDEQALRGGLVRANWPGRFEKLSDDPLVIVDGAHNEQGSAALASTLRRHYPGRYVRVLYAALADKEYAKMLADIGAVADELVLAEFDYPRAASAAALAAASHHPCQRCTSDWRHTLGTLAEETAASEILLICGSLYFVSAVRSAYKEMYRYDASKAKLD
ncbi:MAG: folylpolyglutamate synthase/dihydrofolate synthase family protein [Sporolactobacillus sp.]